MCFADGRLAAAADHDRLCPAGKPGVLVRLHDAGCQQQIGLRAAPVRHHRNAVDLSKVDQLFGVRGGMVYRRDPPHVLLAELRRELLIAHRAVESHAAQQRDVASVNSGLLQFAQKKGDKKPIGRGACGVGEGNHHLHAGTGQRTERRGIEQGRRRAFKNERFGWKNLDGIPLGAEEMESGRETGKIGRRQMHMNSACVRMQCRESVWDGGAG